MSFLLFSGLGQWTTPLVGTHISQSVSLITIEEGNGGEQWSTIGASRENIIIASQAAFIKGGNEVVTYSDWIPNYSGATIT